MTGDLGAFGLAPIVEDGVKQESSEVDTNKYISSLIHVVSLSWYSLYSSAAWFSAISFPFAKSFDLRTINLDASQTEPSLLAGFFSSRAFFFPIMILYSRLLTRLVWSFYLLI